MRLRLSNEALGSIEAIRTRIAQDSPAAAERMASGLIAACESLASLPQRGRPGRRAGTREIVFHPYVIVYVIGPEIVDIADIRHHAQMR